MDASAPKAMAHNQRGIPDASKRKRKLEKDSASTKEIVSQTERSKIRSIMKSRICRTNKKKVIPIKARKIFLLVKYSSVYPMRINRVVSNAA